MLSPLMRTLPPSVSFLDALAVPSKRTSESAPVAWSATVPFWTEPVAETSFSVRSGLSGLKARAILAMSIWSTHLRTSGRAESLSSDPARLMRPSRALTLESHGMPGRKPNTLAERAPDSISASWGTSAPETASVPRAGKRRCAEATLAPSGPQALRARLTSGVAKRGCVMASRKARTSTASVSSAAQI